MASEGTRCETFYAASAVCSPSRVSYFTGRYPIRFNVTWAFNPFTRKDASFPVVPNLANLLKPEDERPTMCSSAGPPPGRWIASSGAARRRRPRDLLLERRGRRGGRPARAVGCQSRRGGRRGPGRRPRPRRAGVDAQCCSTSAAAGRVTRPPTAPRVPRRDCFPYQPGLKPAHDLHEQNAWGFDLTRSRAFSIFIHYAGACGPRGVWAARALAGCEAPYR